jgi:excisionase family DNA binding protein
LTPVPFDDFVGDAIPAVLKVGIPAGIHMAPQRPTEHDSAPPPPPHPTGGSGDDLIGEQLRKLLNRSDVVRTDTVDWASDWRDHIPSTASGVRTPADTPSHLSPNPAGPEPDGGGEPEDPDFDPLLAWGGQWLPDRPAAPEPDGCPAWVEPMLIELRGIREALDALQPRYFTTAQVARRLGVSAGTVRRMIRAGQLRTVRFGPPTKRQVHRVASSEIERLLHSGRLTDLDVWKVELEEQEANGTSVPGEPSAPSPD